MRVTNLSPQQATSLLAQIAQALSAHQEEGVWDLEFELPDGCVERPTWDLDISKPRAVIYDGDREAPLSTQQHALLRSVLESSGVAKIAAVALSVWGDEAVSTNSVRQCAKRVNASLLNADIPFELKVTDEFVILSQVGRI